jgi:hypothetical protein
MHIRAWQGGIRDFRADWRDWSRAERVAVPALIAGAAILLLLLRL